MALVWVAAQLTWQPSFAPSLTLSMALWWTLTPELRFMEVRTRMVFPSLLTVLRRSLVFRLRLGPRPKGGLLLRGMGD